MSRKPYSRYSDYWYGVVMKLVQIYPLLDNETTAQAEIARRSIRQALEETEKMEDGDLRLQAIKMVYFDKTHTIEGAALVLFVGRRTVQRWLSNFVRLVGRKAGYM